MEFNRIGIRRVNVSVTGIAPVKQEILVAQSGYRNSITQIEAANQGSANTLTFYEGNDKLTPTINVPSSGTLFHDDFAGVQYELATGSGLNASLGSSGEFDIVVFYILHDERTPITKQQARFNSFSNITVSRAGG